MTEPNNAQHGHLVLVFQQNTHRNLPKTWNFKTSNPYWTSILRCGVNRAPGSFTPKNGPTVVTKEYDPHGSAPQGAGRDMDDMTWIGHPTSEGRIWSFFPVLSGVVITYRTYFWFKTDSFHGFRGSDGIYQSFFWSKYQQRTNVWCGVFLMNPTQIPKTCQNLRLFKLFTFALNIFPIWKKPVYASWMADLNTFWSKSWQIYRYIKIQYSMHGTFDKHIFFNWDFLSFPRDASNSSGDWSPFFVGSMNVKEIKGQWSLYG